MNVADHILKNTQATIGITFTAGDASGNVTYGIVDGDGTEVVAAGTVATNEATPTGYYTFVLAPQTAVKSLTITWTGTWGGAAQQIVTYAEIVGNHLFTLAEARAYDRAALADDTTYTDATILGARAGITDFFEKVTDESFIPRFGRSVHDSQGCDLWLPFRQVRTLLSGSLAGVALTAPEIADVEVYEYGKLWRSAGWVGATRRDVIVSVEYGHLHTPWDIHEAALIYLRYLLVSSDISDRTVSYSNELGTFRNALPGTKYPTGIPTVDAALGRYTAYQVLA